MLTYLIYPSVQICVVVDFRKEEPVSNFRVNRFLYGGGLNGKF